MSYNTDESDTDPLSEVLSNDSNFEPSSGGMHPPRRPTQIRLLGWNFPNKGPEAEQRSRNRSPQIILLGPELIFRTRPKEVQYRRRSTRISKMTFMPEHESSSEEEVPENKDIKHIKEAPKVFNPLIETIYSRKIRLDYIDNEIEEEDSNPETTKNGYRSEESQKKLNKIFLNNELHYINFDRNTLKVDRVVSCSEMFDIIHPKKAGKVMSKWSDSIVKIVQILINFRYQDLSSCNEIDQALDFSIILNRLYLDYYKTYRSFWDDINTLFEQIEIYYKNFTIDITIIARRLKRVAVYLYQIWHSYASMIFEKTRKIEIKNLDKKMIFEFRDFVLSLFTLKEDSNLQNYAVRLTQMQRKYSNLLYNCDELLDFVLGYIKQKYGVHKDANQNWIFGASQVKKTINELLPKFKQEMVNSFLKSQNEKEALLDPKIDLKETSQRFENLCFERTITYILLNEPNNKIALLAQEIQKFLNVEIKEGSPLNEFPIVKQLMRFEMVKDKEAVRMSKEFRIFREMTEKSILRTIFFYHKRETSPFEWRKYDPGELDYSWTGSGDPKEINVIYEEELEEEEESEIEEEMQTNEDHVETGDDQGTELKLELVGNNPDQENNGKLKIVLKNFNKPQVPKIIPEDEGSGTNFKFTLTGLGLKKNENKIEEESQTPKGKGMVNEVNSNSIGKGLASLEPIMGKKHFQENLSPSIKEEKTEKKQKPEILNFMDENDLVKTKSKYLKMTGKIPKLYLIKWKNVSYNQCTWEVKSDLEDIEDKIEEFQKHNRALDKDHRSLALDKKRHHRRVLESIARNLYSKRVGYGLAYNEYARVLYKEMSNETELSNLVIRSLNDTFKGKRALKKYQIESLKWMIERRRSRKNFILADEMGLGKTIQSMAFCLFLKVFEKLDGPFLIVAPLSTLPHWKKTFEEWTSLNVILYHDNESKKGREKCRDLEWYQKDIRLTGEFSSDSKICKFHVIITSFEVFIQDADEFVENLCIQQIIIDEAHRLKNQNAKVIKVFQRLPCRRISLLTGTPIQNNINELWSLLNFIEPSRFSDQYEFENNFKDIQSTEQLMQLKQILKPFMIRRMKNEVETIPPLEESLIEIELTNFQKVSYKTLYEKNKGILQKGEGLGYLTSMNNLEMQLRKCCNHPFLIREIQDKIRGEVYTQEDYIRKMLDYSSKMIVLDKLIVKYKQERKKMLIFSQFTEMLKLIEEFLTLRKIMYKKIDGATKARDRQNAIEAFNSNPDVFEIFLLSTKAGGLGINLTSANVVLIYDSDWNPQNDVQAIARAHRIGQTEEVKVYRLISKKTYEAEMYRRASKKLGLDQAVFLSNQDRKPKPEKGENEDMLATNWMAPKISNTKSKRAPKITDKDIELLLKKGILGILDDQEGGRGEAHTMDIDELIRNSKTTNYSMINDKYTITRMNVETDNNGNKVDINDPDFWKKVLKDEETPGMKLLKEFSTMKENNDFMDEESQTEFFSRLNEQIYSYVEKAKLGEVNIKEEEIFFKILQQVIDDPFVREDLKTIGGQLMSDIRKKPRRLKKRDITGRKRNTKKAKKVKTEDFEDVDTRKVKKSGREEEEFIIEETGKPKKKESRKRKRGKALGKRSKIEDEGLYKNSDSEENSVLMKRKKRKLKRKKGKTPSIESKTTSKKSGKDKKLKRVKTSSVNMNANICIFCRDSKPKEYVGSANSIQIENPSPENVVKCIPCKRTFHPSCLKAHLKVITESSSIEPNQTLQNIVNNPETMIFNFETNQCINCTVNLVDCFVCKNVGKVKLKIDARVEKNVKEAILNCSRSMQRNESSAFLFEELDSDEVFRCKYCGRHLHIACCLRQASYPPELKSLINQSHQLICPAHKCLECHTRSNSTTLCLKCSVGYHRKCIPSSLERLNNRFFLCQNHQDKKVLLNIPENISPKPTIIAKEDPNSSKISLTLNGNKSKFNIKLGGFLKPKNGKSKSKKTKTEMSLMDLQSLYSTFGLEYSANVDFENYQGSWCRYCGARYSSQFHDSLLGAQTFCDKHFKALEKEKFEISKLRGLKVPWKPNENKEVSYMKKKKKELAKKNK